MTSPGRGRCHLSVVIPAYNEERRLGDSLEKIASYLDLSSIDAEVIVIDDGSSDATARIAADVLRGQRTDVLINDENRGKGYSVRRGVLAATGRWVLLTDARSVMKDMVASPPPHRAQDPCSGSPIPLNRITTER